MKDGMGADEAAEAVQPPSESSETDSDDSSNLHDEEDLGNPHKLKKCLISLKRVDYIEKAGKRGSKRSKEEEAMEAVLPPSIVQKTVRDRPSIFCKNAPRNSDKLKKCFISLKRMGWIEDAVKRGRRFILV